MKRPFFLRHGRAVVWILAAGAFLTCGACDGSDPSGADAGQRSRLPAPLHPAASCPVVIDTPELLPASHVPEGSAITYNSNPPSSGPHYPTWANFQEFDKPLEDGYLVHSLEHGAVALLYKCEGAACGPIVDGLRKVRDAVATDPVCPPAVRARIIIAPAPKLTGPVAAVAWGWTYNAECVDAPTLSQFVKDNYGRGPENICAEGRTF